MLMVLNKCSLTLKLVLVLMLTSCRGADVDTASRGVSSGTQSKCASKNHGSEESCDAPWSDSPEEDPSAIHGEADEETNLLQTAVQINEHQETLVSLLQQALSGSVSPETSLIQAVKFIPTNKKDMRKYVEDFTPGIIGQPGPDPPAQCPTDPKIAKDLKNSYPNIPGLEGEGDACCSVWRRAGHCKGPYENWMTANCAEACCDKSPISPGTTLVGHPGTSCDETCAAVDMKCDNARLQSVDTEEEVIEVAGEAFASCNGTTDDDYKHSPSQCTKSWCKGKCSYGISEWGLTKRGDCSYKGYSWDGWSRFCPCRDLSAAEAEAAAKYAATRAIILGEPGKTCNETCSTIGYVCDDVRLQGVDSSAEVLQLAGEAGISCSGTSEYPHHAYSPSQYTGESFWPKKGTCYYGKSRSKKLEKKRSCSITAEEGYQRLCPCMMSESLLSEHAKSKKDKKGTIGKK